MTTQRFLKVCASLAAATLFGTLLACSGLSGGGTGGPGGAMSGLDNAGSQGSGSGTGDNSVGGSGTGSTTTGLSGGSNPSTQVGEGSIPRRGPDGHGPGAGAADVVTAGNAVLADSPPEGPQCSSNLTVKIQ